MMRKVSKMLHDSIAYALSHREEAVEYALQFGRGLDRARTDKFVGMYVNDLTLDYGDRGRRGRRAADARRVREGTDSAARSRGVRGVGSGLTRAQGSGGPGACSSQQLVALADSLDKRDHPTQAPRA